MESFADSESTYQCSVVGEDHPPLQIRTVHQLAAALEYRAGLPQRGKTMLIELLDEGSGAVEDWWIIDEGGVVI